MLELRALQEDDGADLLAWRNDPVTRAMFRNSEIVSEAEHRAWLARSLQDAEKAFFIGLLDGTKVGVVRFDPLGGARWEVSITVNPDCRSHGHGARLLDAATAAFERRHRPAAIVAEIRHENVASRRIFERCGFSERRRDEQFVLLERGSPGS